MSAFPSGFAVSRNSSTPQQFNCSTSFRVESRLRRCLDRAPQFHRPDPPISMSRTYRFPTGAVYRGAFVLAALLIVGVLAPSAQAIGPDNYGYTAAAITPAFEDLTIPGVSPVQILDNTEDS